MTQNNWHAQKGSEVLSAVNSSVRGLTAEEVEKRLELYGANEIALFKPPSVIKRFFRQFNNILIYVLLLSAIIAIFLEHWIDSSVIMAVVVLNAIFGFIQEGKAEKALEGIRQMLAPNADVIRGGRQLVVPAKDLVVGDIVLMKSGDKVAADLRLIDTKNLQIQESILTGESQAIEKNDAVVSETVPLGDRFCMAYSGTSVTYGRGKGVVVATGLNTEIGKIGTLLKSIKPIATPLLQKMNAFGRWLTLAILVLAAFTFLIGAFVWHNSMEQMFMAAVGLAVAAIPEGLPPILTIILAIGVTRMARRNAIIRQLPAVETMGSVTTICTDKTGTLTRNEQTIKSIVTSQSSYDIKEDGKAVYSIDKAKIALNEHSDLSLAVNAGVLCNDGNFVKDSHGKWYVYGNPIDKALLELAGKSEIDLDLLQKEYPRDDLIPYESEHKFMATLHHSHDNHGSIYIKGAPENILARCSKERLNDKDATLDYNRWRKHIEILAKQGYRVIAIACKEVPAQKRNLSFDDVQDDLTLIAIFGLIDAPRLEAIAAVEECQSARIRVKMITGDHAVTAVTIGSQVGINSKSGILTGSDIDTMDDEVLAKAVGDINIYARTSPQHKLRLVEALQNNGEVVAMTGDGVNDAPALRKADIGVAMGKKGAEIAKESSSMVIADDNFATIVNAIEEGRIVYDNLKKVILHILPTNASEALVVVFAVLFGTLLPITPVQILWINMITAVTLSASFGFEPAETDVMQRAPRKTDAPILSRFMIWRTVYVTALIVACVFGLFMLQRYLGEDLSVARTVAVNMLVFGEIVYLFNCRKMHSPAWHAKNFFSSKIALIAVSITIFFQLLVTYVPIMQKFLGTAAIGFSQWFYIILLSFIIFILVEFEKVLVKKFVLHN